MNRQAPTPPRGLLRRPLVQVLALLLCGAGAAALAWRWPYEGPRAPILREATTTGVLAVTGLLLMLLVAARFRPRVMSVALALCAWWIAVETWAAPHLVFQFRLLQYFAAQDPDHLPKGVGPDWNSDSLRGTPAPSAFTEDTTNVVFLGDSYTYGLHLKSSKEAFPTLVAEGLRAAEPDIALRVANFGWSSSSPYLSFRRLQSIGDHYHPDIVVLCIDMTDFGDDIRWRNIVEERGIYWFYKRLPITLRIAQLLAPDAYERFVAWTVDAPARRFFHSEAPLEETRRHMEPLVGNVADIYAWCTERGADFVLVVLPRSYQHSRRESPNNHEGDEYEVLGPYALEPFKFFDELRARVPYPIVSLLSAFQTTDVFPLCFDHDPHWLPAGHRVAADALIPELLPRVRARAGR
ncbi:MAG: SGNH/GDSL hydrolase family protein [Planctomycetota bacterium]